MIAGLLWQADEIRHTVQAQLVQRTLNPQGVLGASARCEIAHTRVAMGIVRDLFVRVEVEYQRQLDSSNDTETTTVRIFYLDDDTPVHTETLTTHNPTIEVRMLDPRYYATTNGLSLSLSALRIYVNSNLRVNIANPTYSTNHRAPSAVIGLAYTALRASANASPDNPDGLSYSGSIEYKLTGGWRFRIGTTWHNLPCTRAPMSWRTLGCDENYPYTPTVQLTSTDNAEIVVKSASMGTGWQHDGVITCTCPPNSQNAGQQFNATVEKLISDSYTSQAQIAIVPDLTKSYLRLGEHFALWLQAGFPKTVVNRYSYVNITPSPMNPCHTQNNCTEFGTDTTVLHEKRPQLLVVSDTSSLTESECFQQTTYSPVYASVIGSSIRSYRALPIDPVPCGVIYPDPDNPSDEIDYCTHCDWGGRVGISKTIAGAISTECQHPTSNSGGLPPNNQIIPYYTAIDDDTNRALWGVTTRYTNTYANPHWQVFLFWMNWELGDPPQPADYTLYWQPHQQQYLDHPQLPNPQRIKKRSQLLLEPFAVSPYKQHIESDVLGFATLWAGVVRYGVKELTRVASVVAGQDSAPRWTITGGTMVFSAGGIDVVPTANIVTLTIDLADYTTAPYLIPAVADAVRVAIAMGMVDSIEVRLRNWLGDEVVLDSDPSDTTLYRYRRAHDTYYAGSWAQDYKALLTGYSESPQDLQSTGQSHALMGDVARRVVWEMLGARSASTLRITLTQAVPTPFTLQYPIFYCDAPLQTRAMCETSHQQIAVEGEHLTRWGTISYNGGSALGVLPPHEGATYYDLLALRNHLWRGQAHNHQMTNDALADYLQPLEWTTVSDLAQDTRTVLRPDRTQNALQAIHLNAYRELPPIGFLPRKARDIDTLAESGGWVQQATVYAPVHRYYLCYPEYLHLDRVTYDTGGNETSRTQLTDEVMMIGVYKVTRQAIELTNSELVSTGQVQYRLRSDGQDWARVTPFHGYTSVVIATAPAEGDALEIDPRRQWLYWARGASLRAHHLLDWQFFSKTVYSEPIRWLARDSRLGALLIVAGDTGTRRVWVSYDAGETAAEVVVMAADTLLVEAISPAGLWVVIAHVGGQVVRRESLDAGGSWSAPTAVQLDGAGMAHTPLTLRYDARAQALLLSYRRADDTHGVAVSRDFGFSFSTVLP